MAQVELPFTVKLNKDKKLVSLTLSRERSQVCSHIGILWPNQYSSRWHHSCGDR